MVSVRVILARCFFCQVRNNVMSTPFFQWQDQLREHVIETDGMLIKMLGWSRRIEAFVGQVQPTIRVDADGMLTLPLELGNDLTGEIPFATAIDTADSDQ